MSSSKRASIVPAGPKTPTSLSSSLIIADSASLTGNNLITLGDNTVIHPRARLISTYAPLTIQNLCVICERSTVGLQSKVDTLHTLSEVDESGIDEDYHQHELVTKGPVIETGVTIEVGAVVEAARVGEWAVIEVNAKIGKGAIIGKVFALTPLLDVWNSTDSFFYSTAKLVPYAK